MLTAEIRMSQFPRKIPGKVPNVHLLVYVAQNAVILILTALGNVSEQDYGFTHSG